MEEVLQEAKEQVAAAAAEKDGLQAQMLEVVTQGRMREVGLRLQSFSKRIVLFTFANGLFVYFCVASACVCGASSHIRAKVDAAARARAAQEKIEKLQAEAAKAREELVKHLQPSP
jgi:hypothetical protein